MINVEINENVKIAGIAINEEIFQEDKVDWRVEDRVELIINISQWLSESPKKSDKFLMLQDIEYLASIQDKYVFSSIHKNEYIAQSDDPTMFYDICRTILEEQGLTREETEKLLLSNVEITEEQSNAQTMTEQPSKKPLTHVFILQERDSWYSNASAVDLGVFTTLKKALDAATKEYGELKRDGDSECHYEPINNPNDVTIYIIVRELDVFEEL